MKVSVIVPHVPSVEGAPEALSGLVSSLYDYDELIILVNDSIGYSKAVNQGLACATGDFLIVANNDCVVLKGGMRQLCNPMCVTVPKITPIPKDTEPRCFFCLPRWVYNKVGAFDERYELGYYEDDDYIMRLKAAGVERAVVPDVVVDHKNGGGMTMHATGRRDEVYEANGIRFNTKWNVEQL